ncbi:MAG: hypothetical protein L0Y58_21105 [Verrucomicrobia subdivision 3 bacterium]|nr:hypothetical protein [Limisphaerales bacterium]
MNRKVKTGLYCGLLLCLLLFGGLAARSYRNAGGPRSDAVLSTQTGETPSPTSSNQASSGSWAAYAALAFFSLVGLALLFARDFSHGVATKIENLVFNDNLEGVRDPEYDEAERVWANGNHLEAIQLMRDYLKRHPLEQYVAIRIAEIYEKDLGNYLAAALEYEEILKKKLQPDRWGWAAIHLANLYSGKLNKPLEAEAVLRRIIAEHPQTPAAKKGRERLGEPEEIAPEPEPEKPQEPEPAKSNLPPGFRPK